MFQLLIVEDDKSTNKVMSAILRTHGYNVLSAFNGVEALEVMDRSQIDLLVVDIMMPEMDGYELTKLLRDTNHNMPILMVTAKELPEDKRKGFLVGTDDYMTKPIDNEELVWRVKALLRRSQIVNERKIMIGSVVLNSDSLTVFRGEEQHVLPPKEFYLLYKLLAYPGQVFTRLQLLDEIWGLETESMEETVTVHVNRLRRRFSDFTEFEVVSVRGLGYKAVKNI